MSEWKETEIGLIPEDWSVTTFNAILKQPLRNGLNKPSRIRGEGYKMVNMNEIFSHDIIQNIPMELVPLTQQEKETSFLEKYDLLFARQSLVLEGAGKCSIFLSSENDVCFESHIIRARIDKEKANPLFYYYFFFSKIGKLNLRKIVEQAVVAGIRGSDLKNLFIPYPPKYEQGLISLLFNSIDAKIDNLRRQNETLEKIAQTLFKHWFIDFEFPNDEGKPYKSSGGAMSPSELGDIPAGWKVGKLGDVAKNIRLNIKENDILSNTPYIGLEHIPRKSIVLDTWSNSEDLSSNKFIFQKGQILFGKLRPYFHKVGVAFISGICSTDILVIDAIKQEYFGCLLMLISNDNFIKYVSSASEGTRMPRTNWEYMKNYLFPLSNQLKIYKDFTNFINSFLVKIDNNTKQIQTLTKTRDALLPKLMSGEIRIKE